MRKINKIVIHHSAVSQPSLQKAIQSFDENHKRLHKTKNGLGYHIAYHYIIGENGEICQTRPLSEIGFHASNLQVNQDSVGICLVGDFDKTKPSELQYQKLNQIIEDLMRQYKCTIHYHNEYAKKSCPGMYFDKSKVKTTFISNTNTMSEQENMKKIAIEKCMKNNSEARKALEYTKQFVNQNTIELIEKLQTQLRNMNEYFRGFGYK